MSVQPGPTFKRYAANGVAPTYTIPFLLLAATDLQITLDGVLVTTGFTLSGIGNPQSSCTFSAPYPSGDLLFQMVIPFQRLTDYQMNGDFLSQTVNPDFDRLWLAVKQLNRDSSRALTVGLLEPEGIPSLPVKAARALKMLAFDTDGSPVTSNLTLEQLEQQPALAIDAVAQAVIAKNAALGSANAAHLSELAAAISAAAALASEQAAATYASDPWALQPIGVPIPVFTHLTGYTAEPPTNKSYRYIKLTAGESGAGAYNFGCLSSESVTGSAPLVLATAKISLASSPFNGNTISLINTEARVLRAGSSGSLLADAFQAHEHEECLEGAYLTTSGGQGTSRNGRSPSTNTSSTAATNLTLGTVASGANGTPRTANETRAKSIGATYYLRIK